MDCRRAGQIIFLYVDNELGEELHVAFEQHMTVCPRCAKRIEYTRRWLTVVKSRCARLRAPERLRQKILSSLRHSSLDY